MAAQATWKVMEQKQATEEKRDQDKNSSVLSKGSSIADISSI